MFRYTFAGGFQEQGTEFFTDISDNTLQNTISLCIGTKDFIGNNVAICIYCRG